MYYLYFSRCGIISVRHIFRTVSHYNNNYYRYEFTSRRSSGQGDSWRIANDYDPYAITTWAYTRVRVRIAEEEPKTVLVPRAPEIFDGHGTTCEY